MRTKLMINGNAVYEVEEDCLRRRNLEQSQEKFREKTEKRRPGARRPRM